MAYISIDRQVEAPRLSRRSRHPDVDLAMFNSFFEHSGLCIARLDRELRVAVANPDFEKFFGSTGRRSWPNTEMVDLLHPDDRDHVHVMLTAVVDEPTSRLVDERVVARSRGRMLGCHLTALALPSGIEALDGVLVILEPDHRDEPDTSHRNSRFSAVDTRILEGIGAGVSTMQLADALLLSRGGVEYHVKSLMQRFKVRNRPALVSKAYSTGVFRVGHWPPRVSSTPPQR